MKALSTRSDDGTKLQFGRWNEEGERDLLIVHGLAEHIGRYQHIAQFYADRGWRVTVIELRGHGESEGKRGHVEMWHRYKEDLQTVMASIGRPMAILAHSMGGLVTLFSMMHPLTPELKCVALSNPLLGLFVEPPSIKVMAGRFFSKIWPSLSLPNDLIVEHISRDPAVVSAYKEDPKVFSSITARWGAEMLKTLDDVNAYASQFNTPLLLNVGTGDQICSPDASQNFAKNYGGDCSLKIYNKLYHELLNEPEKEQVMQDIHDWLLPFFNETN